MAIAIYSNVLDNGGISKFVYNMHHAFQKKNIKSEIVTFSADTIYGNNITLLSCTNHGNRIMKLRRFILDKDIEELIQKRADAKKNKDFKLADEIRQELLDKGIVLEDTRQGTKWKRV